MISTRKIEWCAFTNPKKEIEYSYSLETGKKKPKIEGLAHKCALTSQSCVAAFHSGRLGHEYWGYVDDIAKLCPLYIGKDKIDILHKVIQNYKKVKELLS